MYADSCYLGLSLCFEIRSKAFTVENKWQFKVFQKKLPEKILVRDGKNLISTPFSTLREKFFGCACLSESLVQPEYVSWQSSRKIILLNMINYEWECMQQSVSFVATMCFDERKIQWWMVLQIMKKEILYVFFFNIFLVMVTLVCKLKVS